MIVRIEALFLSFPCLATSSLFFHRIFPNTDNKRDDLFILFSMVLRFAYRTRMSPGVENNQVTLMCRLSCHKEWCQVNYFSHRGHGGHRGKKTLDNQERKAADELFGICKDHVDRQIPSFSQKKVIK